jgi:DNA repair protein RecN (Recombination protein N)
VDSGVSGDIAGKMGSILQKMAKNHQLITITHAPQVAAKANAHYFVYKTETDLKTKTDLRLLDESERVNEIAKMLSGNPPSQAAIANAKELISH